MQKNETRPLSFTIHKDKLKMVERSKCETGIHQNPSGEYRQQSVELSRSNFFLDMSLETRETKAKVNY